MLAVKGRGERGPTASGLPLGINMGLKEALLDRRAWKYLFTRRNQQQRGVEDNRKLCETKNTGETGPEHRWKTCAGASLLWLTGGKEKRI